MIAALLAVGGGLGLVLAGPIVNSLDYHWLFWIPGAVVAVAAVATQLLMPESPIRTPGRISWLAALLLSGWLVALLVAVSEAPSWGWGSAPVLGLLIATVLLAVGWVLVEQFSAHPLIDLKMMRIPAVWTTNLVALLFGMGLYAIFAFLPEFLQTPSSAGYGFGASITESGLIVLPMSATMFIFGSWSGPLSTRLGAKVVLIAGSVVSIPAFVDHGIRARLHLATDHRDAAARGRLRAGVLGDVQHHRRRGALPSDRRCQRHERQHPHHRRFDRSRADGQHRHLRRLAEWPAAGIRLHRRLQMLAAALVLASLAGLLIPRLASARDAHQQEQAAMSHPELAIVAGGTLVGDEPE